MIAAQAGPRVSVVIAAYNRAGMIGETLASVRRQTLGDFECIIVDDGSTDGTAEAAQGAIAGDGRFRLVRQENAGASHARNRGIALARGPFIALLDSDDLFAEDKLQWQVEEMERDGEVVLVYGETFLFRDGDPSQGAIYLADIADKPQGRAFERLLSCSAIYAPLVRTDAIRAAGGFDTSLPSAEDWDMWLRLSRKGRVVFRPRIHAYYRVHAGNKSSQLLRNYRCGRLVADRHIRSVPPQRRRQMRREVHRYFARVYPPRLAGYAWRLAGEGELADARRAWAQALALRPSLLLRPGLAARVLLGVGRRAPGTFGESDQTAKLDCGQRLPTAGADGLEATEAPDAADEPAAESRLAPSGSKRRSGRPAPRVEEEVWP